MVCVAGTIPVGNSQRKAENAHESLHLFHACWPVFIKLTHNDLFNSPFH